MDFVRCQERYKSIGLTVKRYVGVRDPVINVVIEEDVAAELLAKKVRYSKLFTDYSFVS